MERPDARILTLNGGSSSIKIAVFEAGDSLQRTVAGGIERIGSPHATLRIEGRNGAESAARKVSAPDHAAAMRILLDWVEESLGSGHLTAAGHRVVHGGPRFSQPQRITDEMLRNLRSFSAFDAEHLPDEILMAEAVGRRFPTLPQVACFDTAFHHDLPRMARLLPIPRRYYTQGVRRYGFHGLSYEFLMDELSRVAGGDHARGRVVLAHLGNGASLAAVLDGRPMDTSMAFTPNAGIPMGTRSGDLEPGVLWYLARMEGLDARQVNEMLTFQSGLLGVSESSSDMRELLAHESQDVRAAEAIALFCYQVRKCIGAYAAVLGGLDTLVFTGGIGENAGVIRERVCEGLAFLGVELNRERNENRESLISSDTSRVKVRIIHTDEELMIARSVMRVLRIGARQEA